MLAGETGWFVVLQIFKEGNEDAVTSAVLFSSDRQQPPNTATLQRRSDSCDIFWHRESPKSLWQSVSDVQDVFSLQNSAEEEVVRSLSSKTRLIIFFLGDCLLFWADVRKKLVCVRQSSAKCQTEQQNKQRCGKNTATLLTRSDKYQLFFQKIILLSLPISFFSLEERIKTSTECLNLIIHQKTNMRMNCLFFAALITCGSVYATCKLKAAAQSGWWCRIHAVTWRCRLLLQPADKTGYFQAHVGIFSCLLLLKWTLCLWRQKELKHVFWLGCLWDK